MAEQEEARRRRPPRSDPAERARLSRRGTHGAPEEPPADDDGHGPDEPVVPEDFDVTEPTGTGGPVHRSSGGDIGEGAD